METQGSTDYQVLRDFINELESTKPKSLADVPQEKIDRVWASLSRVFPARLIMEKPSMRAENVLFFGLGVLATFILSIIYHGIVN